MKKKNFFNENGLFHKLWMCPQLFCKMRMSLLLCLFFAGMSMQSVFAVGGSGTAAKKMTKNDNNNIKI